MLLSDLIIHITSLDVYCFFTDARRSKIHVIATSITYCVLSCASETCRNNDETLVQCNSVVLLVQMFLCHRALFLSFSRGQRREGPYIQETEAGETADPQR